MLSNTEKHLIEALKAFLQSLTDSEFLSERFFSSDFYVAVVRTIYNEAKRRAEANPKNKDFRSLVRVTAAFCEKSIRAIKYTLKKSLIS